VSAAVAAHERRASDATVAPPSGGRRTWAQASRYAFLGWLALPMLVYLVPLFEGYAWSALGPGYLPHNVLNPPEEYRGRLPQTRITAESWGSSVVTVPFHARSRQYLLAGELPLWNPYSGLGQPFAAQGEGSPYFPVSIARSLLPYSKANYVTVAFIYLSGAFAYLFMARLGVSKTAATFAGIAWSLSGALSLHLGRPNFADQVCMVPILFWAVLAAVQCQSVGRYVVLALASCLHLIAGHIQIAMLSGLTAPLFGAWYIWLTRPGFRSWFRQTALALGAFGLGNALAGFSLFPMLEAMRTSFTKNVPNLGFLVSLPDANIIGFLTPYLLGQPFYESWVTGPRGGAIEWDNLFAFSGLVPAAIVAAALPGVLRLRVPERGVFLFFAGGFVVILLRYLSAPPAAALNLLPILDRQSPKHATGVMVFFLVVAAGLAVDVLPRTRRRHGWIGLGALLGFLAGLVLTVIGQFGGFGQTQPGEILLPALATTATIVGLVIAAIWLCLGRDVSPARTSILLGGVAVTELSLYVPLGNAEPWFLLSRLGLSVLLAGAALLLAFHRPRLAVGLGVVVLAGYAALIPMPRSGLPRQFEADQPPSFMRWLIDHETVDDRSFGILPDWSSIGPVQDISAVGPLAPAEFLELVRLISDEPTALEYSKTTHFMLSGPWSYNLGQYARARPVLDWLGVRYLVLNRQYFGGNARRDAAPLTEAPIALREVYEDRRAYILTSQAAQSRAEFWSGYVVADDQAAILARLKRDPSTILHAPRVEVSQLPDDAPSSAPQPTRAVVPIASYRPNAVELSFNAETSGLLVLKDVYIPGWTATLNGHDVPIVRVNGLVRGVFVPAAGAYTLRFSYQPASFTNGVYLSLATAALLVLLVARTRFRWTRQSALPESGPAV
jgi:hypothetical protein